MNAQQYDQILRNVINEKRWKKIILSAYMDAIGMKIQDGRLVKDPKSTPIARASARRFFAEIVIGKPIDTDRLRKLHTKLSEKDVSKLSDAELQRQLDRLLEEANRLVDE